MPGLNWKEVYINFSGAIPLPKIHLWSYNHLGVAEQVYPQLLSQGTPEGPSSPGDFPVARKF